MLIEDQKHRRRIFFDSSLIGNCFVLFILVLISCTEDNPIKPTDEILLGWQLQSPITGYQKLFSVRFADAQTGWIVGSGGKILYTSDGGINWVNQQSGTENSLLSLSFVDNKIGWASGGNGTIVHTANGGLSWELQNYEDRLSFKKIAFLNESHGWASGMGLVNDSNNWWGGILYQTADGGMNWSVLLRDENLSSIDGFSFIDSLTGWITGGYIWGTHRTNDGGKTWQPLETLSGSLNDIIFFNDTVGVAYSRTGAVAKTTDGGIFWNSLPVITGGRWLHGMSFPDILNGWIVGEYGYINHTYDGGQSWSIQESGTIRLLFDVYFIDAYRGWVVGDGGIILRTIDGGETWEKMNKPTIEDIYDVDFIDRRFGWVVGRNGLIMRTTNGGQYWQVITDVTDKWLQGVDFVDRYTGWVVGEDGLILKTINGGISWTTQSSGVTDRIYAVYFNDRNKGWAVGSSGNILHTVDGGQTWIKQTSGVTAGLHNLFFLNENIGWVVGESGSIIHTKDGGSSWEMQLPQDEYSLIIDIHFVNENKGWALGRANLFYETTDGGVNWNYRILDLDTRFGFYNYIGITFFDEQHGWIVGEEYLGREGLIIYTDDGGETWIDQTNGITNPLFKVKFVDRKDGWIVGDNGTILHTISSGL